MNKWPSCSKPRVPGRSTKSAAVTPAPLIVTRPEPEASDWVARLAGRGIAAQALPLLFTQAAAADVAQRWQGALSRLAQAPSNHWPQAWMAVSAPAVRFAQAAAGPLWQPAGWAAGGIDAWATGPGTRGAWIAAGWPAASVWAPPADAPQFDSEALWSVVQARVISGAAPRPVWLLRGSDASGQAQGRDWLLQQLQNLGVPVASWPVYQRVARDWTRDVQHQVDGALAQGAVWLFSSSEALGHWHAQLRHRADGVARARLLVTHPRMAERAAQLGLGVSQVWVCKPDLDAVAQAWAQASRAL